MNLFRKHIIKHIGAIGLIGILFLLSGFSKVVDDGASKANAHIKAVFIYNFTKYIEWPDEDKKGDFIIGVIGDSPLYSELYKMAKTKKRGNQTIQVDKYTSMNAVWNCHMLFLSKGKSDQLSSVVKKMASKHTLIITERKGLINKGSAINFVIVNNKQVFELNRANVKSHSLSLSSGLVAFAKVVI